MSRLESIQNFFVGLLDKSQDKQLNPTAEPSSMSKLLPKDDEWLNNLYQKANPNFGSPPDRTDESFWVKLPPKRDARSIRENLLRENFGFDKADIAAYDRETKNGGLVVGDSEKPQEWATTKEIGKWNIRGSYVEISISKEKAAELRNFRVSRVIDKSLASIGDPLLRESVKQDLMATTAGEGFDKTRAADRLLNLEVENPVDAEAVRSSIRVLARQPENQNNAVIQIVAAKVDLAAAAKSGNRLEQLFEADIKQDKLLIDKLKTSNSRSDSASDILKNPKNILPDLVPEVQDTPEMRELRRKISDYKSDVEKTARLAGGFNKISDAPTPNAKINRQEAAWANRQAADIYRHLGDEKKAVEREMMARYYEVDDKERNSLEFKFGGSPGILVPIVKVIPRLREGESAMSATSGETPRSEPPTEPPQKDLAEEPYKLEARKYEKT